VRLKDDHLRAKKLAEALNKASWVKKVLPVETNIVIFEVRDSAAVADGFEKQHIRVQPFSPTLLRMATHLDFTEEMLEATLRAIDGLRIAE
jgi:threonine aldolase